jgi:thioredoxin reductase
MQQDTIYDVIIVGGSYAGLQAATTLGRALRKVLVIDSGKPCNQQTPHSHNFLTQDRKAPAQITATAKMQLARYTTVSVVQDEAVNAVKQDEVFKISTIFGKEFTGRKILFSTGIKDLMPDVKGFAECWGISVIHCPYCHGYEVHDEPTGILANGDVGYEYAKLISNWTNNLTLFSNGPSTLTLQQTRQLQAKNIVIVEDKLSEILHNGGQITRLAFEGGRNKEVKAIYARVPFEQHCQLPLALGCEFTSDGLLKTEPFGKTKVKGLYAAGDNSSLMRSVAGAVAAGMAAAAMINKELLEDDF